MTSSERRDSDGGDEGDEDRESDSNDDDDHRDDDDHHDDDHDGGNSEGGGAAPSPDPSPTAPSPDPILETPAMSLPTSSATTSSNGGEPVTATSAGVLYQNSKVSQVSLSSSWTSAPKTTPVLSLLSTSARQRIMTPTPAVDSVEFITRHEVRVGGKSSGCDGLGSRSELKTICLGEMVFCDGNLTTLLKDLKVLN
jgi:hypothetical protein